MLESVAEIRDPVHGYISVTEVEKAIMDLPVFQRLRRIRQLAGAHLTYPGAQHSRFEHSLGTLHLCGIAVNMLAQKTPLTEEGAQEVRLAAMLHDLGHGPFSHVIEEVMVERRGITHEDVTKRVIKETEVKDVVNRYGFDVEVLSEFSLGLSPARPKFLNEVVGGGLSVDIMDYLLRDSYFTGVEYGKIDAHRIINSFEVVQDHLALDQAALYAFEALMVARYEMFRAVYFHRTVRAAELMLIRSFTLADDYLNITDTTDLTKYLSQADETLLEELVRLDTHGRSDLKKAKELALAYKNRSLLKCVFEKLIHRKDQLMERLFSQKRIREEIASKIASEANISPEDVYIDVPTTPSVPYTSDRKALTSIILATRTQAGLTHHDIRLDQLPLVGAISGFFDILRVYTSHSERRRVQEAAERFFGKEGYVTKISM
ncbi:MAG: HD domain-containing protein [Nitrososphaerales archaeon]